jgi:hypothetical protein
MTGCEAVNDIFHHCWEDDSNTDIHVLLITWTRLCRILPHLLASCESELPQMPRSHVGKQLSHTIVPNLYEQCVSLKRDAPSLGNLTSFV